jgi:hypothetical protein
MSTPTVTEARQAIADAINAVTVAGTPPLAVTLRPRTEQRAGQGWTQPPALEPAAFGGVNAATISAIVVLGTDLGRADELYDLWASPVLTAATSAVASIDATVTPEQLLAGDGVTAAVYILTLTLTMEVQ